MSEELIESVSVLFSTPPGDESRFHERILTEVPKSKAGKMVKDFLGYQGKQPDPSPFQVYRYEDVEGGAHLVGIDFHEVMNLSIV